MAQATLPTIVFLSEVFPFDLAGGSQQRWASTILTLTQSARVQLLCFQSQQKSRQETDRELNEFAQQLPTLVKLRFLSRLQYECVLETKIDLSPGLRMGEWLKSFFTQQPFLTWQYQSSSFQQKFQELLITHKPKVVHIGHLRLAQFLPKQWLSPSINKKTRPRLIYEALNVEWQLVKTQADYLPKLGRWHWWWQREVGLTKTYEAKVVQGVDHVFAICDQDAAELKTLKPRLNGSKCISVLPVSYPPIPNVVPPTVLPAKFETSPLVFMGNLEWLPNADALRWFLTEIWPDFAKKFTTTTLTIIGKPCSYMVLKPNFATDRVRFLGFVKNVNEILTAETIFILPFRMGSGVRFKALTAAWTGSTIVSTPLGVRGLKLTTEKNCLVAETATHFKHQLTRVAYDKKLKHRLSVAAQKYIIRQHGAKLPPKFWRYYWGRSGLMSKTKALVNSARGN